MTARARVAAMADSAPATPEGGRAVQEHYEAEQRSAESARAARNRWVQQRVADGWTHAEIASALGLSRGRIGQMK